MKHPKPSPRASLTEARTAVLALGAGRPTAPLEIHRPGAVRRVLRADRQFDVTILADCPQTDPWVSLSRCGLCGHCEGVAYDAAGLPVLLCSRDGRTRDVVPRVADVMTRDVICVDAAVTLYDVAALLLDRNIGGAPVVDPTGRALGMVTRTDLLRTCVAHGGLGDRTVADVMTGHVFAQLPDAPLTLAAAQMDFERVHRVAVVDTAGSVVGMLSTHDLTRWMAGGQAPTVAPTGTTSG